jgi:hypothetical protein
LIEQKLTPSFIAFCATAPRVRRSFLATLGPESFAFARVLKSFTSSFDHARTTRFFFAIIAPQSKASVVALSRTPLSLRAAGTVLVNVRELSCCAASAAARINPRSDL